MSQIVENIQNLQKLYLEAGHHFLNCQQCKNAHKKESGDFCPTMKRFFERHAALK